MQPAKRQKTGMTLGRKALLAFCSTIGLNLLLVTTCLYFVADSGNSAKERSYAILVAALIFCLIGAGVFFRRSVLSRIIQFSSVVQDIADKAASDRRLAVEGDDELASLAHAINGTLDEVQKSGLQLELLAENMHQAFWVKNAK